MKTLPIRCRPSDTRPIRAIAYEAAPEANSDPAHPHRDPCPTLQFITRAKQEIPKSWDDLAAVLNETAKNGPPRNDQKFAFLKDGIYEFKAFKLRIACFFDRNLIICTHGFYKKQQKTPKDEIAQAKQMRTAYSEAKKNNQLFHVQPTPPSAARQR
jgi:phage-related protein